MTKRRDVFILGGATLIAGTASPFTVAEIGLLHDDFNTHVSPVLTHEFQKFHGKCLLVVKG